VSAVEGPSRSLADIGRDAARTAQRAALLATLEACGWRMSVAAETLRMGDTASVLRAIKRLGLTAEYDAARERGLFRRGRHHLPMLTVEPKRGTVAA
jgi:hypothetical protein